MVLAPVVRGRKGEYGALLDDLAKQGFARARVDGVTVELAERGDPGPGPLRAAHHRGGGRPAGPAGRHPPPAHRVAGDGPRPGRGGGRDGGGRRRRHRAGGHHLQPAPGLHPLRAQLRGPRRPGTSPSTRPTAPARPAPAWAPGSRSTPSWWCPTPTKSLAEGALAPWSGARSEYFSRMVAAVAELGGFSLDTPWEKLPQGRPEAGPLRGRHQAGPSQVPQPLRTPALLPHPLRGHRPLAAAAPLRGRVRLPPGQPRGLPARGALPRVRRGPAPARVAGRHRRGLLHLRPVLAVHRQGRRGGGVARPLRPGPPDRRPGLPRGPRADAVPARRGPRLPDPGPLGGHPVRGRGPADPAGQPDRQRPGRGALRARRAVHRPPPAGQPAPDRHPQAPARPGQHGHRGRARRGDHPGGRPRGRRGPGGGGARRPHRPLRPGDRARRPRVQPGLAHRPVPRRGPSPSRSRRSAGRAAARSCRSRGPGSTTCTTSTSTSRSASWWR